ncbi:hypothetical protein IAT40_006403 [Kwoniella sp. CBS 6097]
MLKNAPPSSASASSSAGASTTDSASTAPEEDEGYASASEDADSKIRSRGNKSVFFARSDDEGHASQDESRATVDSDKLSSNPTKRTSTSGVRRRPAREPSSMDEHDVRPKEEDITVIKDSDGVPVNLRSFHGTDSKGSSCLVEYWSGTVDGEGEDGGKRERYFVSEMLAGGGTSEMPGLDLDEVKSKAEHSENYKRIYSEIRADSNPTANSASTSGTAKIVAAAGTTGNGYGTLESFKFDFPAQDQNQDGKSEKTEGLTSATSTIDITWADWAASLGGGRRYSISKTDNDGVWTSVEGPSLEDIQRQYAGKHGYMGAAAERIIDFASGTSQVGTSTPGSGSG